MKRVSFLTAVVLVAGVVACAPAANQTADKASATGCEAGAAKLAVTGLCPAQALAAITPARVTAMTGELPEGCSYTVAETATPDANEAILYRALSCKGKTTQLEFSAGARSAAMGYGVSGFFDNVPKMGEEGADLVRLFRLDGAADPKAMILTMAKATATEEKAPAAEIAACELRAAGEGFPADALVVDVNDAYQKSKKLGRYDGGPKDDPGTGVYAACGSYGFTDARVFWMIRDGYAWFVNQGQDIPDFDAGSLTVFRKGADGAWAPAKAQ